jgi:hypothetical protein
VGMMIDDEELLAKLRHAMGISRAVPPDFMQAARNALAALPPSPDEPALD